MRRRAFGLLAAGLALAACTPPGALPPDSVAQTPAGPNSGAPAGARVGLLLPLSGPNAGLGQAMLQAARLAIEVPGAPAITLDPQDTAGTPEGAANAARQAVASGDGLLIGPITAPETAAAAPAATAAAVPMLAFTSDPSQARPGVWTLGITPGQQVRRLVAAAQADGRTRFAGVLPDNPLGVAMADALRRAAPEADLHSYPAASTSGLQAALADASQYDQRHPAGGVAPAAAMPAPAGPAPAPIGWLAPVPGGPPRLLRVAIHYRGLNPNGDVTPGQGTATVAPPAATPPATVPPAIVPPPTAATANPAAPAPGTTPPQAGAAASPAPPPPFDALLVGEAGSRAQALGPMLARDDLVAPAVRVLGPGLWQTNADRLGGLAGAWFAAPDPAGRVGFVGRFAARFGHEPPPLADLAYDAASLARVLAQGSGGQGFPVAAMTRPEGFGGTDGVLALAPGGQVRRGLAVFEIQRGGGARIVSPSPASLASAGV